MHWRLTMNLAIGGLAAAMLCSCASTSAPTAATTPARLWPPPPDEARISYVGELRGPQDIGANSSAFHTVARWFTGDTGQSRSLHKPFAIALDENGNLCLTDTDNNQIIYADFTHKQWRRFTGVGKTKFASPVAVARHNGIFYVADSKLAKVFAFQDNGKSVFEITTPLQRPVGLAMAGDSLYVVDSQAHCVSVFGLDGKFQFSFGKRGDGPGEFNYPTCATVDNQGHLIVSDTLNSRIQVFDLRGNFISQFGSNGNTSGHFARPKGVGADSEGHIYVIDAVFDNFQIFSNDGKLLLNVGESGRGPGGFGLPNGIAITGDNKIYVTDCYNHRVQIFKYLNQP